MIFRLVPIGLALALLATSAQAGVTLTYEGKSAGKERSYTIMVSIEGNKLRVDSTGDRGGTVMIFDGDQKKMISVDPEKKTYMEITEADVAKIKKTRDQMQQQLEERLKQLPPEQRKKMEEMMGQMGQKHGALKDRKTETKLEPLGGRKSYHGFSCETYRRTRDGQNITEECIIPWKATGLSKNDFQVMEKFDAFFGKMGGGGREDPTYSEIANSPGVPAFVATLHSDGSHGAEEELTRLKRQSVPSSAFTAPAGFTKTEMSHGAMGPE
jgi:hypothetical protein